MDEEGARAWLRDRLCVSRETMDGLDRYVSLLRDESAHQNLIARSTLDPVFARHIVDSAQLVAHAPCGGHWLDLGSGAGLPGLVIAILTGAPVTLVESRRLRIDWLVRAAQALDLPHVVVEGRRLEQLPAFPAAVITARAFAPLDRLFALAHRFSTPATRWVLPKGRGAAEELASTRRSWHGRFELVPSVTDPASAILLAEDVRPKTGMTT